MQFLLRRRSSSPSFTGSRIFDFYQIFYFFFFLKFEYYQRCPLTRSRSAKLRYRLPLQCAIWAPGSILIWTCRLMCLRLVLARFIICTISGTLGSICLVSPPRGLFTRSSQAGLTTVMVYCTVLLSIKLRNFKES